MSGKNFKRAIVVAIGLLMALLLCLTAVFASGIVFVSAEEDGSFTGYSGTLSEVDLYNATNTYAYKGANPYDIKTEEGRLYQYYDVSDNGKLSNVEISDTPQITVLTHGLGGSAAHWSNQSGTLAWSDAVAFSFAYSPNSLISRIDEQLLGGEALIYWAAMTQCNRDTGEKNFFLVDLKNPANTDSTSGTYKANVKTEKLTDVSKHIIVIFEATSTGANGYNNETYEEFNFMLSKLVYDVRYLSGKLPKINLIGHSRGGITNLQYALDHPDLVADVFSMGTPYFGSDAAATEFGKQFCAASENGRNDIISQKIYTSYYDRFMDGYENYYRNINFHALGGYSELDYALNAAINDSFNVVPDNYKGKLNLLFYFDRSTPLLAQAFVHDKNITKGLLRDFVGNNCTEEELDSLVQFASNIVLFDPNAGFFDNVMHILPVVGGHYIMSDVLVQLNSQIGQDKRNDVLYEYPFHVYTKKFEEDARLVSLSARQPAVVHNLEAQDPDFINYIVRNIEVGSGKTGFIYDIKDDGNGVIYGYRGSVSGMNTFEIPSTVDGITIKEIGSHAFDGVFVNSNVTKIIIPNTVTTIGNYAFYRCSDLSTIEFSNGSNLQTIEEAAFAGCSLLSGMNFPVSLTQIGQSAFEGTALSSFTVRSNLTHIGQYAFLNCKELTDLTQDGVNPNYAVENGVLYNADKTELLVYPAGKKTLSFTVPDSVTEINSYAIYGNPYITSLDLNQVASIGYYGLAHNSSLGTISGGNLLSLEANVVEGTAWYENQTGDFVALGDMLLSYRGTEAHLDLSGYKSIASFAFVSNSTLESVTFGNDTSIIGNFAFLSCDNLSRANLYNVNQIIFAGSGAFGEQVEIVIPQCLEEDYLANEIWRHYSDQFVIQETTVHFTSDGQTVCPDGSLKYYEPIGELPVPSKEGYVFEGWHYTLNGNDTIAQQQDLWLLTEDEISFTAEWSLEEYNIVYHLNGGMYDEQDDIYIDQYTLEDVVTYIVPTYNGYTFAGWYYDAELTEYAGTKLAAGNIGNFDLYAKWRGSEYSITFNLNDDMVNPAEYTIGNNIVTYGEGFSFAVPTREGYTFNGWMISSGSLYTNAFGESNRVWDIAENTELYASWTRETYFIKVDADGTCYWLGTSTIWDEEEKSESGIAYGTEFISIEALKYAFKNLAERVPKPGYKFEYFTLMEPKYAEIGEEQEEPGEFTLWDGTMPDVGDDGAILTIYAYYIREINFAIHFLSETTEPGINPVRGKYGEKITLMVASPLTGHTFQNWVVAEVSEAADNSVFEGTSLAPGTAFSYTSMPDLSEGREEDGTAIFLKATYAPNSYTITFANQYGSAPSAESVEFGTKCVLPVPSEVNGRTFIGWYTGSEKSGTQITNTEGQMLEYWTIAENAILYAGYDLINYTITFEENGGTPVDDILYNIDSPTFDLPETTTRSGHRFMGWYDNSELEGTRVYQIPKGSTGNKTFYAKWSYLYTITFKNNGVTVGTKNGIRGEDFELPSFNQSKVGHTLYWDGEYEVGYEYIIVGDKTFQAEWEANTYAISFVQEGGYVGAGGIKSITIKYGEALPQSIEMPKRDDCINNGYYYSDYKESNLIYDYNGELNRNNTVTGSTYRLTSNIILKLNWSLISCEFVIDKITYYPSIPVTVSTFSWLYGGVFTRTAEETFTYNELSADGKNIVGSWTYGFTKWGIRLHGGNDPDLQGNPWHDFSTERQVTFSVSQIIRRYYPNYRTGDGPIYLRAFYNESVSSGCVAAGTLITLADGTQKTVEELTGDEMLLVWNLQTGTFDTAPILFIDSDPAAMYSVINLYFSDGTQVKVISEHGLWDYDLNKYVYLDKDAVQYIGHWFNKFSKDENGNSISEKVQLVNVVIQDEYTTAWSPVTYSHLCYYVNGMLSMPGGIEGLFNIFEVDAETMKYDEAQMQADIAQYGLFTYEEFAELFSISEEVFEAFNGQYLKVAIGKGLIDAEGLQTLIEHYAGFLNTIT